MPASHFRCSLPLALGLLVALAATPVVAQADGDPATDTLTRVIPYEGTIEVDGTAFTGTLDLRFTLYDDEGTALWSETWAPGGEAGVGVPVYAGTFSVLLGQHVPLTETVVDAADLFVGLDISTDDFVTFTPLAGRQRVGFAPFAVWASAGADFSVNGELAVAGGAAVDGDIDLGGDLRLETGCVRMDDANVAFCGEDRMYPGSGVEMRVLENPADGEPLLRVLSAVGAERLRVEHRGDVEINNHLLVLGPDDDVDGNITANGGISAGGALDVDGTSDLAGDVTMRNDLTVQGDLTVTGDLTNLTVTSRFSTDYSPRSDSAASFTTSDMVSVENSICFLTGTLIDEPNDAGDDLDGCVITQSGGGSPVWRLAAFAENGTTVQCRAQCLQW